LTAKRAHAWLFVGFEMILLDKIQHVDLAVTAFALTRVIEVVARTSACVIVSALSTLTARRHWAGPRRPRSRSSVDSPPPPPRSALALGVLP
jgi:hypothetical protein